MQQRNRCKVGGCTGCCCRNCMFWWSQRCPYGGCFDDFRAQQDPYDRAHWCRGGVFFPIYACEHYVKYKGQQVKTCLKSNVSIFQDGYIECSLIDALGCEACYKEFLAGEIEECE